MGLKSWLGSELDRGSPDFRKLRRDHRRSVHWQSEAFVPFLTPDPHGWNLRELTLCVRDWSLSFKAALTTIVERSVALRKLTITADWADVFPAAPSDSFLCSSH
jgi:hypothetical protein